MIAATAHRRQCGQAPAPTGKALPARYDSAPPPLPLGLLAPGERAEVLEAVGHSHAPRISRTEEMGLRPGRVVEMLAGGGGRGPLLVKVDESRLALGRGMAMKILVRRLP